MNKLCGYGRFNIQRIEWGGCAEGEQMAFFLLGYWAGWGRVGVRKRDGWDKGGKTEDFEDEEELQDKKEIKLEMWI